MKNKLPKVSLESSAKYDIEVKSVADAYNNLIQIEDHDPFAPHRIQFYFILIISQGSYSHFVDFQFYTLRAGSALFISKNQVHHFTKGLKKAKGFCIVFNPRFLEKYYLKSKKLKLNRLTLVKMLLSPLPCKS